MIKIVNGVVTEMTPEEISELEAGQVSYVPPPKTKLYKSNFIRRLSPSEAATLEGVLLSEDPWVRMLYHSVEYFMAPDALVGYLHMVLTGLYGEERADVLLEMEE